MTSQNKTPVMSRELWIFFLFWPNRAKALHAGPGKCSSTINILKLLPKFFLLIFFTSSHIFPLLFIFPLLYFLVTLKPRDNSKKLKTLLQSQLSLLLSQYSTPNSKVQQNQFSSASVHVQTLPQIKPYSSWSKSESSKLPEI